MKNFSSVLVTFLSTIVLFGMIGWILMPGLMLIEHESPYDLETTITKIKTNVKSNNWSIVSVSELNKSIKKHINKDIEKVVLINICEPNHAYNILKEDKNKIVSVMMPCTISVYNKKNGKTYIGTMNAGLLGKMFGGSIAEVMGTKVAEEQKKFISFVK